MAYTPTSRGRYLRSIPPSHRVRERLDELIAEAKQLRILLRLARELEQIDGEEAAASHEQREPANV